MKNPATNAAEVPRPDYLGGGTWKLNGLKPVTAIFGKNGSGKSKLLRQWRDIAPQSSHYVVPERAGEIDYQANFLLPQLDAETRRGEAQRNFAGEYRRQVVARIQAYFSARGDIRGGALPTDPEELERLIAPLLPDFTLRLSGTKAPPYELRRVADGSSVGNIDQLSSGETQILTLALDILTIVGIWDIQDTTPRLLLVDEPDAHIHPDLQVRFADFLVNVAERFDLQVVIATHSTTLLAAIGQFAKQHAGVVYLDRISPNLKVEEFSAVLRELSACLGGHALMGPLFGSPLLLVEGDDDYRIWSQVPRYHVVNLSVIPCGGDEIKKYQRSLERVFAALREPGVGEAGFALIDRDKGKPTPDAANPQDHIRYIQLECHESENLYLSDEVLASLETDWPSAAAKIASEATKFGQKADILSSAPSWNRKTCDIKRAIEEIATILDAKRVHWTIRVAKTIGTSRPTGQIGEFLGDEVVNAIWGPASDAAESEEATEQAVA